MAAVRVLLCSFCIGFIGWGWVFGSGGVVEGERSMVLNIARGELGVKEATGCNDGERVEQYLAYVGMKKGQPWCSAYLSWCFGQAGYTAPRTAWSPGLFPKNRLTTDLAPAVVYGIWFHDLQRIAHCGMIESVRGDWITGLEGNTVSTGTSRNGNGVFRRIRHKRSISKYADWINSIEH